MQNLTKLAKGMNHRFPEGNEAFQLAMYYDAVKLVQEADVKSI